MFTGPADVRLGTDRNVVTLLAPLTWWEVDGQIVAVPTGFASNGASVPRLLWALLGHPLDRRLRRAAILHDWECAVREVPSARVHRRFFDALRADGCARWRAGLLCLGVRAFGPRWEVR